MADKENAIAINETESPSTRPDGGQRERDRGDGDENAANETASRRTRTHRGEGDENAANEPRSPSAWRDRVKPC
jgi:hypothetical protein